MTNERTERAEEVKGDKRQTYEAPECRDHEPLEIMSEWEDRSSELPGI